MLEARVALHLRRTHQKMTQIMRERVDQYGLTLRLLHILILINKNPELSQKELSKQMRLTKGAVSGSVKELINLAMLRQVPLEADLRFNRLVITEYGLEVINDYEKHVHNRYKEMFRGFSQTELTEFDKYLTKINQNLAYIAQQEEKNRK